MSCSFGLGRSKHISRTSIVRVGFNSARASGTAKYTVVNTGGPRRGDSRETEKETPEKRGLENALGRDGWKRNSPGGLRVSFHEFQKVLLRAERNRGREKIDARQVELAGSFPIILSPIVPPPLSPRTLSSPISGVYAPPLWLGVPRLLSLRFTRLSN